MRMAYSQILSVSGAQSRRQIEEIILDARKPCQFASHGCEGGRADPALVSSTVP
jgi:hypothetical protein